MTSSKQPIDISAPDIKYEEFRTEEDVDQHYAFRAALYGKDYPIKEREDAASNPRYFAIRKNGEIIAAVVSTETEKGVWDLKNLSVVVDYRKTGLLEAMLQYAEREAMRHGVNTIRLHSREIGIPFFTSQGYKVEDYSMTLPKRGRYFEMTKALSGNIPMSKDELMAAYRPDSPYDVRRCADAQELKAYYQLRYEVLRKPWNQPADPRDTPEELKSVHIGAFFDGELIGCGRVFQRDDDVVQIRSMAVCETHRRKGVGERLLVRLEQEVVKMGALRVMLHARENAVPFYTRNGYQLIERSYLLFGEIQHYEMQKEMI